ncbi:cupin domain-containing protein [Mycolicibacterium septicum DSM 44393]|uniref:Cupin domain-containing protein n=1 Tax=Mycolicibacterium septicum DSM 44393 TaxID=1341646 RepID=A0A7X6RUZ6_9MYCO|nr:cupin domain-containing protein [Mycolicibacterium septicum]NKZ10793.1 cupin domain-containing protein [Mycolicibacterium septicum DSM 44393]
MTADKSSPLTPSKGARVLPRDFHPTQRHHSKAITKGDPDTALSPLLDTVLTKLADGEPWAGIWSCGPCELNFAPPRNVAMVVLEGKAQVTFDNGESVTLRSGDLINVEKGSESLWQVDEYYKEFVVWFP